MNMQWRREFSTTGVFPEVREEVWKRNDTSFPMRVKYGKITKLFTLKQGTLEGFNQQVDKYRGMCKRYFSDPANIIEVSKCMLCGADNSDAVPEIEIHGIGYYRCDKCDLRFLRTRLSDQALDQFYTEDQVLTATLTDVELVRHRIDDIVRPKVDWAVNEFQRMFGSKPAKLVDVGAGGGHFVYAARECGLDAVGIEPNEPSRIFAKDVLGIALEPVDFLTAYREFEGADIITFWAVLEHLPNFMNFLSAAKEILRMKDKGLIIVEVPRWHSLGTIVQEIFSSAVNRHLFPLTHLMIFFR